MLTLKKVNQNLKHLNIELVKGNGYFYFVSDIYMFGDSMVLVNTLNSYTLEGWIEEAMEKINSTKEN